MYGWSKNREWNMEQNLKTGGSPQRIQIAVFAQSPIDTLIDTVVWPDCVPSPTCATQRSHNGGPRARLLWQAQPHKGAQDATA